MKAYGKAMELVLPDSPEAPTMKVNLLSSMHASCFASLQFIEIYEKASTKVQHLQAWLILI